MRIVCISASNIQHAGESSTSLKVCRLIKDMAERKTGIAEVEVISLACYELKPCIGCGYCFSRDACIHDNAFNSIFDFLCRVDALFIVSAHYAPIPSKLAMLLEKTEQLTFLKRFNDESYRCPLFRKPVGIIGHGGGTEDIHRYYQGPVIDSIWNALSYPVEMNIIGIDAEQPRGITFPVKSVSKSDASIFPVQEYDWADIEARLDPLIDKVITAVSLQGRGDAYVL